MGKLTLREIQEIQKNMLFYFDAICRKNGIKYSIEGGTLLGAIKYGGFIPWDDDIDIVMEREYYEMFLAISKRELDKTTYIVESYRSDINFPLNYAKMCDTRTIIKDYAYSHINTMSHGVFIDIFPLDKMTNQKERLRRHTVGFWTSVRKTKLKVVFECNFFKKILFKVFSIASLSFITKRVDKALLMKSKKTATYLYELCNQNSKFEPLPLTIYENLIDLRFEDHNVLAISKYDVLLKSRFGDNYMNEMPPIEKRIPSHCSNIFWKQMVNKNEEK